MRLVLVTLVVLAALAAAESYTNSNVTVYIPMRPPRKPALDRQVVDGAYHSFSIEMCFMAGYAGNSSRPNRFSQKVLRHLYDISGFWPIIRAGGSTQSSTVYVSDQKVAIIDPFSSVGAIQPGYSYIGPKWMQSFRLFPHGTQYIYGLNFFRDHNESLFEVGNGLKQVILEANAAYDAMGDSLYAYEIGNEVDSWAGGLRRGKNWNLTSYVHMWNHYATKISETISGNGNARMFHGWALEAPRSTTNATAWNVYNAELNGMTNHVTKTISDHEYMGANCHYTGVGPTIEATIFNRTNMLQRVWYHDWLGNAMAHLDSDIKYVIGETNSIACAGAENISNVMAAAIWVVDYVLYLSSLKVTQVHFHQGTRYRHNTWTPVFYNDTKAHVNPLYYGALFNAHVFAGGEKQTEVLINETNFGAYAIYTSGTLEKIVAVNLNMWNFTMHSAKRPYTALELPRDGWSNARVYRLTSPGIEPAQNITMAGQYVDENAEIVGKRTFERIVDGHVLVGAGEAVLIER